MIINLRLFFVGLLVSFQSIAAPIQFEDTSNKLGFTRGTETWGIAWGNLNKDKYPDLWNSGHRDFPRLYQNTGMGGFDDVTMLYDRAMSGYWLDRTARDVHSGAWGDYDNDGDDDLLVADEDELFINEASVGGYFIKSTAVGGNQALLWNNTDSDRDLEVDNFCGTDGQYLLIFDLDNDGDVEKICGTAKVDGGAFPHSMDGAPSSLIPTISATNDAALGDFNNDLRTDFVLTRGTVRPSGAKKIDENTIEGWFREGRATEFTFSAPGEVVFLIDGRTGGPNLPADRYALDTNGFTSGSSREVSISYTNGQWKVQHTGSSQAYVRIRAQSTVSEPIMDGLGELDKPQQTAHGINTPLGIKWIYTTGLNEPKSCVSVVAADFDNDMDLDLYMACRNGVENLANRYFDNNGNGTFTEVLSHGGEGPVGAGIEFGVADSVITADYDIDGFMDIAVSNGLLFYPVSLGGPDTLIHNKGNDNHWVELDLIGTISPRAAIGAKVYLTAGGVTQLREQSAGYHRWSQNYPRIHFGLAENTIIDEIRIEWPSGEIDVFSNISVDSLYDVEEKGAIYPANLEKPVPVKPAVGEECGKPPYTATLGPVLHIWKICGTDDWRMRARGGLSRLTQHRDLIAEGSIVGTPVRFRRASGTSTTSIDLVDNVIDTRIGFRLLIKPDEINQKGINFNNAGQNSTCLSLNNDSDDFEAVYIGSSGNRIRLPYDIVNMVPCSLDSDSDGIIDSEDPDDDNDGVLDINDAFPYNPNESRDSDGDGVGDNADIFPNDSSETTDGDGDGIGDNSDVDQDNDGISDVVEDSALHCSTSLTTQTPNISESSDTISSQRPLSATHDGVIARGGPFGGALGGDGLISDATYIYTNPITDVTELHFYTNGGNAFSDGGAVDLIDQIQVIDNRNRVIYDQRNVVVTDSADGTEPLRIMFSPSLKAVKEIRFVNLRDTDYGGTEAIWREVRMIGKYCTSLSDIDGDGIINSFDLDSDNDTISDVVEAGLFDSNNDFLIDDLINEQGIVLSPPDLDGDSLPDYLDLESNNPSNDASKFDILSSIHVSYDTNFDGMLSEADLNGGIDSDGDGIDDLIDSNLFEPGTGTGPPSHCFEPSHNSSTEQGVFLWKNCSTGKWELRLSGGGDSSGVIAAGKIISSAGFTGLTQFSLEPNDTFDNLTYANEIVYELKAWNAAVDGFGFTPLNDDACFILDTDVPVLLGKSKLPVTTPLNLDTLGSCDAPQEPAQCGSPVYDRATEPGLYIWKDCTVTGATDTWQMTVAGGGLSWSPYIGTLTATNTLVATGFQLEANDTLDSAPGDGVLDFNFKVANTALDGADILIPANSQTCFVANSIPAGAQVYVGRDKVVKTGAFNLENLGICQ